MNEMDKKKKIILISSIITLIILGIISATVAYFGWEAEEESLISVRVTGGTGSCSLGTDNNISIEPVASKEAGRILTFTAKQEMATSAYISWNMIINEINGLNDPTFIYELVNTTTGASYGSGNFADITDGSTITFSNETEILSYGTEYTFTLYLWIDGTIGNNPLTMAGQDIDFDMNCVISDTLGGGSSSGGNLLIDFIRSQYTSGNQTLITQATSNDSYYYSYQDAAQTWGLMNDGLKIDSTLDATTTGLATTVTDTTALTTGTEGNIRYFGPSDSVNNYIYFNCDDYSNQSDSTCELWRIIGIVDGKVKIIRNDSIGNLAWDQDKNQDSTKKTYNNNWTTSSLQEFLNGLYYNRGTIESHPYYSGSNGTTTTTLNLKTIGITEATRNNNLILESTWYLGGYSTPSGLYPNEIYNYERQNKVGTTIYSTNDFIINKNIGLMYASDYGYGTDLTKCSKDIYKYDTVSACKTGNWLFNSSNQWLTTPHSSISNYAWIVNSAGRVLYNGNVSNTSIRVRPVLYLDSELGMESGHEGTSIDPYRISIS